MIKHIYGCQNTAQEFLDHMYEAPVKATFDKIFWGEGSEEEYNKGYRALWTMLRKVYQEMVFNPQAYCMPLVEDKEYTTFNAKARESLNAPKGFIMLLRALAQAGTIVKQQLVVSFIQYQDNLKKVSTKEKVLSPNKLINCLINLGFKISHFNGKTFEKETENFIIEYPQEANLLKALKSLGQIEYINNDYRIYSLNYDLFADINFLPYPVYIYAFLQYLQGDEQQFFAQFHKQMMEAGFHYINSPSYRYCIEYFANKKDSYIVRCLCEGNQLKILLRTKNIEQYIDYIQQMPERIKYPYHHGNLCADCPYYGKHKSEKVWRLDNNTYQICVYNSQVAIKYYNIDDVDNYIKIILLEAGK